MYLSIIKFIIIALIANYSFANEINEEKNNFYQIKIILISHNKSNYIEYDEKFINDKYISKLSTKIIKNNCVINNNKSCVKYDLDYKLDNFNEHIKSLNLHKDIEIISHLEWVQEIDKKYFVKIKGGHDFSDEVFNDDIILDDIDILSNGKITKYEGSFLLTKEKFFQINISLFEKMIMEKKGFFSTDVLTSKKYIINQNIMLNKTTYIDRNNFGIIIKVNKIKEI